MNQFSFSRQSGPDDQQLDSLFQCVQRILQDTGMTISPQAADALRGKAGFRVIGGHVRISRELVRECVDRAAAQPPDPKRAEWELELLSSYPIYHYDFRTLSLRPMDVNAVIELTRLTDSLLEQGVVGSTPGVPQDVPPGLRHLKCLLIGAQYSRFGPDVPVTSPETAQWMLPMLEITGTQPEFGVFILNPLRCEGNTLDTLIQYPGRFGRITVGSMPMMGLTAPVDFIGATLIGLAGAIGTLAVSMAFAPEAKYLLEPRVWPVDFKTLNILYGWPETELSTLLTYRFLHRYGLETGGTKAFHTSAIFPDAQANGQRGACGMARALAGVRKFTFGGLLATDMVFSAHQLLFDLELMRYYKKMCQPIAFDPDRAMAELAEVGASGSYLERDETLDHFQDIWRSAIWNASSLGEYLQSNQKDMMEKTRACIEELISRHQYRLDETKDRALNALYQRAAAQLA